MANWYVIQVLSGKEKKVYKTLVEQRDKKNVQDRILDIILPTENVSELKNGETRIVEKKLWPGYILVKMEVDDESWSFITETNGVVGFLGSGGKPTSLTDEEVEEILADLREKKDTVTQKHQFDVGDTVKIVEGVFENFIGTVVEIHPEKAQVSVNVSIFGRDTRVDELDFSKVEEVTEEV